jgi:hypothetical protein
MEPAIRLLYSLRTTIPESTFLDDFGTFYHNTQGVRWYCRSILGLAYILDKLVNTSLFYRVDPEPEFIEPVFAKTSPKRSFSLIKNERFGLVFAKTESINSDTGEISRTRGKNTWGHKTTGSSRPRGDY